MALVSRIRENIRTRKDTTLVDGHLVIGGTKVDFEAIAMLSPVAFVIVTGDPTDILAHLIHRMPGIRWRA